MRTSITTEYKMLKAEREAATWPTPAIMPEQILMDYTEKHGRKEGLLLNNRMHNIDYRLTYAELTSNKQWVTQ